MTWKDVVMRFGYICLTGGMLAGLFYTDKATFGNVVVALLSGGGVHIVHTRFPAAQGGGQ